MDLNKIEFLKDVRDFEVVTEGYSGAEKYLFTKDGRKYFIKIGRFNVPENLEIMLLDAGIPHPTIVESGRIDSQKNYIIEEFAEGRPLKFLLDNFDAKFIYEFGFRIGEKYRNLRHRFPDKSVSEEVFSRYMKDVDNRLERLDGLLKANKSKISENQLNFINFTQKFLKENRTLVKDSVMVMGHTDVKPSNFLVNGKDIKIIDFEGTHYKELSLAILWSFCRADFKDEKNYMFVNGYLDGLFNFNVPKGFLKCCNYTYLFNMSKYFADYIEKNDFEKLDRLIKHIYSNYMENGEIQVDKKILKVAKIEDFSMLKDFQINLVNGSYSCNNFTFSCVKGAKKYFLKIMRADEGYLKQCLNNYQLMQDCGIPVSQVHGSGFCECTDKCWVLFDFIDYPEMHKCANDKTFEDGVRFGEIVGKELIKLKKIKNADFELYNESMIYKDLIKRVDYIFENSETNKLLNWTKSEILIFIEKFIKSFEKEPINLIHGDVKFGNTLFNGKDKVVFVDNESLKYSYDIINFLYNISSCFDGSATPLYQGFVNGYLKIMNDGKIPDRIGGQVKLLLLAKLLREVYNTKNNSSSGERIESLNILFEKYVEKDEVISWLK